MSEEKIQSSAIEICGLSKFYGQKKALSDINFNVKKGEVMGFLGPNGAGKSTAMNIITGYLAPSKGKIIVDGINTLDNPMDAKRKIGYLPEIPPLYTDMTVLEYLDFVYELKGVKSKKQAHLRKVMEKVRIYDVKNRMIRNLSKGYKQRVGLAQALIGDPDILILDEPTVGLDPRQILEIRDVISELGKERTVILSTHIMQEVMAVCDSYTIINHGKIVATGSMNEFSAGGSDRYRICIKTSGETAVKIARGIENLASVKNAGSHERGTTDLYLTAEGGCDIRENTFNCFASAGVPVLSFAAAAHSLEEIFMKSISEDATDKNPSATDGNKKDEEVSE